MKVFIQTTASCGTKSICGGTIIGPNHVLTAASCFDRKPYTETKIFMKTYTINPMDADAVIRGVANQHIFVHPNYARDSMGTPINDIAILAFRPCLYYYINNDLINKVNLPVVGETNSYLYYSGQAVGWGYISNGR
ncbi:hypothetical protein GHT06_010202 [Daphnia sinensis]|uniref:Peptidase S1 domain-containing protein n=1 Tax=Daphnia sinensis TaxID=1820382 RepID=A0AAD5LI48_9CRUS|nr:hypothetical protein GHT06_010202 [Daphnia sinensis]